MCDDILFIYIYHTNPISNLSFTHRGLRIPHVRFSHYPLWRLIIEVSIPKKIASQKIHVVIISFYNKEVFI